MNNSIIQLQDLTIDVSTVRSEFSADGLPRWTGKVALIFQDAANTASTRITANWSGVEEQAKGALVDFEGEPEDGDPIYARCEKQANEWSEVIAKHLGRPSTWDARIVAQKYTRSLCHASA
jgi:hypothetical protein